MGKRTIGDEARAQPLIEETYACLHEARFVLEELRRELMISGKRTMARDWLNRDAQEVVTKISAVMDRMERLQIASRS